MAQRSRSRRSSRSRSTGSGFLGVTSASEYASRIEVLRAGLQDVGYVEGKNLAIVFRWADGNPDRLPGLAADLVQLKVDVLVTHSETGVRAAKQATATIPIVMAIGGDVITTGIVANLARPGGNVTGQTVRNPELAGKRLELLKEALPRISRVAILVPRDNPSTEAMLRPTDSAAKSLKISLHRFAVRGPSEFDDAFAAMAARHLEGLLVYEHPLLLAHGRTLAGLAAKHRLPSAGVSEFAESGGLIGYGVNILEVVRRAALLVDKILRGANPGDLPIEQAAKFQLVVNLKTATALGIAIPQSLLLRAVEVIR